ncbi:hypothetical protein PG993_003552 [Apiospora rasikravindrae]|uniref:Uncharacterized protein n=1 Tax=Apiospora rasikravindrae TaxID=990691 RepID=A0ABR1TZX4_9PEZI
MPLNTRTGAYDIRPKARRGPYADSPAWNKGMDLPKGMAWSKPLQRRFAKYKDLTTGSGTLDDPKVLWVSPFGEVPGPEEVTTVADPDDPGTKIDLNTDDLKQARGEAVDKIAWALAKDLGFPFVIVITVRHQSTGKYEPDDNHVTLAFTNDLAKELVCGHVYTVSNKYCIPYGLSKFRAVNGNVQRVIDLNWAETKATKIERERKMKEEANVSKRTGLGRG